MFIDTHCHLNFHQFDADRDEVVQRALDLGVEIIVNPAVDLATSRQAIELAERYPGVYAQVGVHPNDTADFDAPILDELAELARHPKVVAIGEIGLDYYWERVPHAQQWAAFEAQLELAARLDLPVVLHCRDAHADLRDTLRKWVPGAQKQRASDAILGVLHAYSGDRAMAEEAFGWNMTLSFGGPLTFSNARGLHALLGQLPLDRLLLETDAPYLTPHPHRGKRNEPAYIPLIAQGLAGIKDVDVTQVAASTSALAKAVFAKLALHGHNCDDRQRKSV
jgi:TatD DNase family protein